jgi:hypothetical protein
MQIYRYVGTVKFRGKNPERCVPYPYRTHLNRSRYRYHMYPVPTGIGLFRISFGTISYRIKLADVSMCEEEIWYGTVCFVYNAKIKPCLTENVASVPNLVKNCNNSPTIAFSSLRGVL